MSTPSIVRGVLGQLEHLLQAGQPLLGIDVEHLGLGVRVELAAVVERFEHVDLVAQPGGLLELQRLGGRLHLVPHLRRAAASCLPSRNIRSRWMSLAILLLARSAGCRGPCTG